MDDTKTITLGSYFDAIEKNGLDQAIGTLYEREFFAGDTGPIYQFEIFEQPFPEDSATKIVKACALGQGNINTGIRGLAEYLAVFDKDEYELLCNVEDSITRQNDILGLSFSEIVENVRIEFAESLTREFTFKTWDWSPWL